MKVFDYMNFNDDGYNDTSFVIDSNKFTKEQAIEFCITENDWLFKDGLLRKPTIEDITDEYVKWCNDLNCYIYCYQNTENSFPAWVIEFDKLDDENEF